MGLVTSEPPDLTPNLRPDPADAMGMTDIIPTGILRCALCGERAVARLTVDWLCADHVLIELAGRVEASRAL